MKTTVTASDIMTESVLMAYEGWSIKRLSEFLLKNQISGAPVISADHSLVGVVTTSDVVRFEGASLSDKRILLDEVYAEYVGLEYDEGTKQQLLDKADENCTVHQVMTKNVVQVDEKATLQELAYVMLQHGIRRVFVTKQGIIRGVVSTSNILKALAQ
jgi:predicted transcriptional regulator